MTHESAAHRHGQRLAGAVTPTTWRYLAVATLVRIVDGGSAVALVTLVVSLHGQVSYAAAGLLAALLTASQLLAPLAAEPLSRARDPRRVLAAAFTGFGVALVACGLFLDHGELALAAVAATAAGCAGPLVTGGLSTQSVAQRACRPAGGPDSRRRAEALDAATYGAGSTVGPIAVAGVVVLLSPLAAVVALGAVALAAAGGALILPAAEADSEPGRPGRPENGMRLRRCRARRRFARPRAQASPPRHRRAHRHRIHPGHVDEARIPASSSTGRHHDSRPAPSTRGRRLSCSAREPRPSRQCPRNKTLSLPSSAARDDAGDCFGGGPALGQRVHAW